MKVYAEKLTNEIGAFGIVTVLSIMMTLFLISASCFAGPLSGVIYSQGSDHSKALFTFKRVEEVKGGQTQIHNTYTAPDGGVAVVEEAQLVDGKVARFSVDQNQLGESGFLEVKNGEIHFSYTKEGKTKTDQEDLTDNFIVTPTLVPFLQSHWDKILNGDTVDTRFGVLDRRETVGFKFFKIDNEAKSTESEKVLVKMKPTSMIISALVKPLIFVFDRKTKKLLEIKGRTAPKLKSDGKWKDLDADVLYN